MKRVIAYRVAVAVLARAILEQERGNALEDDVVRQLKEISRGKA